MGKMGKSKGAEVRNLFFQEMGQSDGWKQFGSSSSQALLFSKSCARAPSGGSDHVVQPVAWGLQKAFGI